MSLKQIYEERRMQNEPEDISDSQLIKEQMNSIGELQEQIAKLVLGKMHTVGRDSEEKPKDEFLSMSRSGDWRRATSSCSRTNS